MITQSNIIEFLKNATTVIPQYDTDEIVSYLPLCHVAERLMSVIFPLHSGATVNFAESVETIVRDMQEILPTFFWPSPASGKR